MIKYICPLTVGVYHRDLHFSAGSDSLLSLHWPSCFLKQHRFHRNLSDWCGWKPAREMNRVTPGEKAAVLKLNDQF